MKRRAMTVAGSDLISERSHALTMALDELFALSRRLAVLFYAVAELEEAVISGTLCLGTSATSAGRNRKVSSSFHYCCRTYTYGLMPLGLSSVTNLLATCGAAGSIAVGMFVVVRQDDGCCREDKE